VCFCNDVTAFHQQSQLFRPPGENVCARQMACKPMMLYVFSGEWQDQTSRRQGRADMQKARQKAGIKLSLLGLAQLCSSWTLIRDFHEHEHYTLRCQHILQGSIHSFDALNDKIPLGTFGASARSLCRAAANQPPVSPVDKSNRAMLFRHAAFR